MNGKGFLIVFSGFSGAGKGTIMKELLKRHGDEYCLSISATTRKPREGEKEGRDYFFKSRDEFAAMREADDFLESAEFAGNLYGTPKAYVLGRLSEGKNVILEIEMQGGIEIKKMFPDTLLLFCVPPDFGELKKRLYGRGTESKEELLQRYRYARMEAERCECYDYLIVNDRVGEAAELIHGIIQSRRAKMEYNTDFVKAFIDKIKEEEESL